MGTVLGVAALGGVLWLGEFGIDAVFNPWAHPVMGRSTLTGSWVGTFTDVEGRQRAAQVELRRTTTNGYYEDEGSRISGDLEVCGTAERERYEVAAQPNGWRGRTFVIRPMRIAAPAHPHGYRLLEGDGEWQGDEMTWNLRPAYWQADGGMYASGERYAGVHKRLVLALKRGSKSEFEQRCSALLK